MKSFKGVVEQMIKFQRRHGQTLLQHNISADGYVTRKPVALVILSGGGFTFETKCLLSALEDKFDFIYLKTAHGGVPGEDGIPYGKAYAALSFASKTKPSVAASLRAFFKTFAMTLRVIRRTDIDLVLAAACSHAVPMLLAGRLLGRRTICIESITRVDRLSNTGKLVYHLRLASTFLVQWPNLRNDYPLSRLGTIL
jgi:UDP-N-acetylglucosamine:LPS N-acetylglucosamine transferase